MRAVSRARAGLVVACVGLSVAGSAAADPPRSGVRLDGLQPASPDSMFLRAEGPHDKRPGMTEVGLSLGVDYAEAPLRVVLVDQSGGSSDVTKVVDRALLLRASASFSPVYWMWIDLQAPFSLFEQTPITGTALSYVGQAIRPASSSPGLGDLRAGLHFRPIDTPSFDLVLGGRYWAPVGSMESYLSDGRFRAEADLGVAGRVGPIAYGCTVSVAPLFFTERDGDRVAASCAVHGFAMPSLSFGLEPSFAVYKDIRDTQSTGTKPLSALTYQVEPIVAARFNYKDFAISLAGGPGFGDAPGTPQVRGMLQLSYRIDGKPKPVVAPSKPTDIDLDGIPNDTDACPEEAGPDSQDEKRRGCPFLDLDGDLIPDQDDACPNAPGTASKVATANGCPDADNDLLPDPIDQCKTEPGDTKTGCPTYARLDKKGFTVNPPIAFTDPSSALTKQAKAALEEVAATMRANPKIGHLSIGLGTKGSAAALSDKRAEQISLVLRNMNVDPQRFEVVLLENVKSGVVELKLVK